MKSLSAMVRKYREVLSYLFWGGMTTLVSWGSYAVFTLLFSGFSAEVMSAVANLISWIFAVVFAFVTNKIWVFCSKSWATSIWLKEFGNFLSARFITGVLEIVGVPFLIWLGFDQSVFGIEGMMAKMTVSILVVILNYFWSKYLIFKAKGENL